MKNKLKISFLLLAALLSFSLTGCGKDSTEPSQTPEETEQTTPPAETVAGTTINAALWDLTYDETDGLLRLFCRSQRKGKMKASLMRKSGFPLKRHIPSVIISPAMDLTSTNTQSIRPTI